MPQLPAVHIADHIIGQSDISLPGKTDSPCGNGTRVTVYQTTLTPVPMRSQNCRKWSLLPPGTKEISRHKKSGITFKIHLLHRVILMLHPVKNMYIQIRSGRL